MFISFGSFVCLKHNTTCGVISVEENCKNNGDTVFLLNVKYQVNHPKDISYGCSDKRVQKYLLIHFRFYLIFIFVPRCK